MPYAPHIRMSVNGSFKGAAGATPYEIWSWGLALAVPGGGSLPLTGGTANAAFYADMAADVLSYMQGPGVGLQNGLTLDTVKFAPIEPDGTYGGEPTVVDMGQVFITQAGALSRPPQVALCISLGTDAPLDRVKGRYYLPAPSFPLGDDGRISDTAATTIAQNAATFLNALNNQPGIDSFPGLAVCVASTKGQNWRVDECRAGRVLDTIRSRRNAMDEAYSAAVGTG